MMAISTIQSYLFDLIERAWTTEPALQHFIHQKQQNANSFPKYQLINGQLRRKEKLVVVANTSLRAKLLHWVHSSPLGGHSGRDATLKRLKQIFYWKGMNKDIQHFVRQCTVCQACKYDTSLQPGLLQPLPLPEDVWVDISMDFIEGLPKSQGKEVIWVVVD